MAEHFLKQNHKVIGVSRATASISHPNYTHFAVDLRDEKAVRDMFNEIGQRFGAIDHLINNAGISNANHSLLMPTEEAKKIFDVNFFATFICCQEAARLMRNKNFGRIVNFSSAAVPTHSDGLAAYASSKAAIEELTRILAKELGAMGITVNCVGPTAVATDLMHGISQKRKDALKQSQAIQQDCTLEDVVNAVEFFLSPKSRMITAQVLYLGGFA